MNRQIGLTLVELMVSLALGLLLLAGLGTIYVSSSQTYHVLEASAQDMENGDYALDAIGHSLRRGGFVDISLSNSALNATDQKIVFGGTPIFGVDGACASAVGGENTDMITVQYDGMAGEQDCEGGTISAGEIVQETFFVRNDVTRTPSAPVLRCQAVHNSAVFAPPAGCPVTGSGSPLVDNVEDLEILYGVDASGDQSADSYSAAPGDWGQVVDARVCLRVRSDNQRVAAAQRILNCSGALGLATGAAAYTTAADSRLRRIFVSTFNLRNRIEVPP